MTLPVPDQGVLYEDETKKVIRDCCGHVVEWPISSGMAQGAHRSIEYGLTNRDQWNLLKDHFRSDEALRFPSHWDDSRPPLYLYWLTRGPTPYQHINWIPWEEQVKRWKNRSFRLELEGPSMIGMLKEVMGFENFCYLLYDDPDMLEEIIEARTALAEVVIEKMLEEVEFDVLHFWEDLAFNNGPMIAPEVFERLTLSRYKRLTDLYYSRGGKIVSVDSDGDIWKLIPVWLKAGVNHIWPMEYKAGMDVVKVRKEYGDAFSMRGGINKYALMEGKEAIDRELDRIAPVVQGRGYIPMLDHHIPEGIRFENFCYYIEQKKKLLGCP